MIDDKQERHDESNIRINLVLKGTPSRLLSELRSKGYVRTYSDAIVQGIRLLYDRIIQEELRGAHFHALEDDRMNEAK
jgi:hypothetical protein